MVINRCYRRQQPQRVKFVKSLSTTNVQLETIGDDHNQQEISDEIIDVQPSNIDHNDNSTQPQSITASPQQIVTQPIVSSVKKITADSQASLIPQTTTAIIMPITTALSTTTTGNLKKAAPTRSANAATSHKVQENSSDKLTIDF